MSGAITFPYYQTSNRVPGTYADVDASQANTASAPQRTLIVGSPLAATMYAAAPFANVPQRVGALDVLKACAGPGSHLSLMAAKVMLHDQLGDLWVLPVADSGSGVAASGSILFSAVPTKTGVLNLYVAGVNLQVLCTPGMTAANVASAVVAAASAVPDLPVTAAISGSSTATAVFTAKNKGIAGNDIDIRTNYLGAEGQESDPAGLTYTITAMSGGLTNPSISTGLANLGDRTFDFIILAFNDTANLNLLKTFLADDVGRWSWEQMLYGGIFAAYTGTYSAQGTFGATRNDEHGSVMGVYDSPEPSFLWAAAVGGASAASLRASPAKPLQDLVLYMLPPPNVSRFSMAERNALLYEGMSTFKTDDSGTVTIDRLINTYQTNAAGQPDDSWLDVETDYDLMDVIRTCVQSLSSKFSRKILVADGTPIPPGSDMVTSQTVVGVHIADYYALADNARVQNPDAYAKTVKAANLGRGLVGIFAPIQLANQLRQIVLRVQFTKP
jgi:phage tail sheath gpL-like